MKKKSRFFGILTVVLICTAGIVFAGDTEIAGVKFSQEKTIAGKTLNLNGVALRKALVVVKVFAGGFYLEKPTQDAREAIESEQVKHLSLHYLTSKATAKKIQEGFIEAMEKANPPELVEKHRQEIDRFASWLDTDMQPGSTTES
ncbi:MAG: chalcone isomerase family protein, partial [Thermodesulfobacteriota bacterium]|nr:chalcone isomerase family protein [Thermodesulfobacteriota bacterium]